MFTSYFDKIEKVRVQEFPTRKDFALCVTKSPMPDFFFKVYDKKFTWDELPKYLNLLGAEKLVKVLSLKDEEHQDQKTVVES